MDGFRHFAHIPTKKFYNGLTAAEIRDETNHRCGVGSFSEHGIAARGVLLDYWTYAKANGNKYEPFLHHEITYDELVQCGKSQGIDIRPESQGGDIKIGDILMIRSGFVERYHELTEKGETVPGNQGVNFAGVNQEEAMLDWLHDCYFSIVAGDSPCFEAWPSKRRPYWYLHEYLLALWGTPIGEMWDLERLSAKCHAEKKWTFFMTSSPANVPGGVGSHMNAVVVW
jgi:hypothetical protein